MADADRWNGLVPLDDVDDLELADNEPDPRGWDVISADGKKIGEVDELLVDPGAMKVRYLAVDVDEDELDLDDRDRRLMIPVRAVELNDDDDQVLVHELQSSRIRDFSGVTDLGRESFATPIAGDRPLRERETDETIDRTDRTLRGTGRDLRQDEDLTDRGELRVPRVEEELDIGKERVKAGDVHVRKTVETEHVSRPVELRHEEVEIERRPVDRELSADEARLGEKEFDVPVMREKPVVDKRAVIREELVLRKRGLTDTRDVGGDIRKEHIHVDRAGDADIHGDTDEEDDRG